MTIIIRLNDLVVIVIIMCHHGNDKQSYPMNDVKSDGIWIWLLLVN
ncbi:hypothetical protein [Kaarinaea lacus]